MTRDIEQLETSALLDGRYQLHERVGIGGMAEVFRAEDVLLGRTVAIKLMRADADVLAAPVRAQREVSALATVTDPSLVTLLEAKIGAEGPRYLVMEFVEGPTLAQRLHEGPLPMRQVRRLAVELAGGLHAVHAAGLVHRDIKPSNILLAPAPMPTVDFHVKLADFGLAQLTDAAAATTPGLVLGTAAYLAPEQVRGEACGPAADIYAFGLVLMEAISGERAFPDASGIGAVIARLVESPAIPDGLDPQWSELLLAMTATDPAERPTALEIARILARPMTARDGSAASAATAAVTALPAPQPHLHPQAKSSPAPVPFETARHGVVRHRRGPRVSRPLMVAASVAAAGVVCASAMLTGVAFPATGSSAIPASSVERVAPGMLPGAGVTAEEPLTVDTVDTANVPALQAPDTADATTADAATADPVTADPVTAGAVTSDTAGAPDAKAAEKAAEKAAREADKQAAAQQRAADKDARAAARDAKKNRP